MTLLFNILIVIEILLLAFIMITIIAVHNTTIQWLYLFLTNYKMYKKLKQILKHGIIHYYPNYEQWYHSDNYENGYNLIYVPERKLIVLYDDEKILLSPFYGRILKQIKSKIVKNEK